MQYWSLGNHLATTKEEAHVKDGWVKEREQVSNVLTLWGHCQFSSVQLLSCVQLFVTPWTTAHQASLSITNYQSLLKLMSIESVMPSNHFILCFPLLLRPSNFLSIRVFSNELVLHIMWPQYCNFSFSISPSNEYSELISLWLTGLMSLQSKGLSKVFSNTTVQNHQFFSAQFSLWSNSHIHTWLLENHSFDKTDHCQQSNVSAF